MGARHSSSPSLSFATATEDQATALASERIHCRSLNFPRLVVSRGRYGQKKLKSKRNVSATFNINACESAYDSQDSNVQSCVSSMSSNQNVFSSTSSFGNGSTPPPPESVAPGFHHDPAGIVRENLLLNINTATEEGLMTLPGVTRQTARNIVGYRKLIGGFKNTQDIALVSGVGASLYVRFRSDITCYGSPPEVIQEQQKMQTDSNERKSKSSTFSKHSSASSSGIDIATINEDDDHNNPHQNNNNNNHNIRTVDFDNDHDNSKFHKHPVTLIK